MTKEIIPVRLSHLLRHCSVGAIVRGPEYLLTVQDIRNWSGGREILYVNGVRSALGIKEELREPPIATELRNGQIDGECIPVTYFPFWTRCPNPECGMLHYRPWHIQKSDKPHCTECDKKPLLEQVPWVLVHPDGHMADVPWHYLAHCEPKNDHQRQCRLNTNKPHLRLFNNGELICQHKDCKAKTNFSNISRIPYKKASQQPWIADTAQINGDEIGEILEVNDTRVHTPKTRNALVIPPESRIRKGTVVDRLYRNSRKLKDIELAKNPLALKATLKTIMREFDCSKNEIEEAVKDINRGYPLYGKELTPGILLESEYRAILDEIPDMHEDEDFVTQHLTESWKSKFKEVPADSKPRKIISLVSNLVSVNRLKEIQVFEGFQRLGGSHVPPDIVGESNWLPAIELYGEGIFFSLEEDILKKWESHSLLLKRTRMFHQRYVNCMIQPHSDLLITPRFILLHTLSHLLIRQLESEAGYPAASLKERIYSTSGELPMSGILIYVAVPDIVGSLGGLAEIAQPSRLLPLLCRVFEKANWCSLDPVCSEHEGQGPSLLNRAACHACSLIPEPSCAHGNLLLDRTFIRGDLNDDIPPLLDWAKESEVE